MANGIISSSSCIRPIDQKIILTSMFTKEFASFRDQSGTPLYVLDVKEIHHEEGKNVTKADR